MKVFCILMDQQHLLIVVFTSSHLVQQTFYQINQQNETKKANKFVKRPWSSKEDRVGDTALAVTQRVTLAVTQRLASDTSRHIRAIFIYFLHCSKFYTLPFYYQGHVISKTVSLSSLAHLLPVLVRRVPPCNEKYEKWPKDVFGSLKEAS